MVSTCVTRGRRPASRRLVRCRREAEPGIWACERLPDGRGHVRWQYGSAGSAEVRLKPAPRGRQASAGTGARVRTGSRPRVRCPECVQRSRSSKSKSFQAVILVLAYCGIRWGELTGLRVRHARALLGDYLRQVIEVDVPNLGPRRNPRKIRRPLESLARSVGQAPNWWNSPKTSAATAGRSLRRHSTHTSTRSTGSCSPTTLRHGDHTCGPARNFVPPPRYFVDPSIGPAALGIGTKDLLADLNAAGFQFEALAVRDLRIYAQPLGGFATPGATPTDARSTQLSPSPAESGEHSR